MSRIQQTGNEVKQLAVQMREFFTFITNLYQKKKPHYGLSNYIGVNY